MRHSDFCQKLNESSWRCWIHEVGFGVPFQAEFLMEPGASSTVISTASFYDRRIQDLGDIRSVSRDGAEFIANRMVYEGSRFIPLGEDEYKNLFALSVTGSHKSFDERGDSHAWICILPVINGAKKEPWVVHVTLDKLTFSSRKECSEAISNLCKDFISAILLEGSIDTFIQYYQHNYTDIYVDVIDGPGITLKKRLALAGIESPIVIRDGQLIRVADVLRQNPVIYRGSFNPPTKSHIAIGGDSIYEICVSNARKGTVDLDHLAHRVRMLNDLGKDVMISFEEPLFDSFHGMLSKLFKLKKLTYVIGLDTFNEVVNPIWYRQSDKALTSFEDGGSGHFSVVKRDNLEVIKTSIEDRISYDIINPADYDSTASSTKARGGDLSVCYNETANYIKKHFLYENI